MISRRRHFKSFLEGKDSLTKPFSSWIHSHSWGSHGELMESVKITWWFGGPGHPLYIISEKRPSDPRWTRRNSIHNEWEPHPALSCSRPTVNHRIEGKQGVWPKRRSAILTSGGFMEGIFPEDKTAGLWGGRREFCKWVDKKVRFRYLQSLIHADMWNSQGHALLWRQGFFTGRILGQPDLAKEQDVLLDIHLETVD